MDLPPESEDTDNRTQLLNNIFSQFKNHLEGNPFAATFNVSLVKNDSYSDVVISRTNVPDQDALEKVSTVVVNLNEFRKKRMVRGKT
jgi:hypothetical protein